MTTTDASLRMKESRYRCLFNVHISNGCAVFNIVGLLWSLPNMIWYLISLYKGFGFIDFIVCLGLIAMVLSHIFACYAQCKMDPVKYLPCFVCITFRQCAIASALGAVLITYYFDEPTLREKFRALFPYKFVSNWSNSNVVTAAMSLWLVLLVVLCIGFYEMHAHGKMLVYLLHEATISHIKLHEEPEFQDKSYTAPRRSRPSHYQGD